MKQVLAIALLAHSSLSWIASASDISSLQQTFIKEPPRDRTEEQFLNTGQFECPKHTGPIDATSCDYENIESINEGLLTDLRELVKIPFFKYLQLDLYRGCPFWEEDAMCTSSSCSIGAIDESEIPEQWRTNVLSKVDSVTHIYDELAGCYYRDSDFCFLEDSKVAEYFDLSSIPERYTGYSGPGARQIWKSIYEDNCFSGESTSASDALTSHAETSEGVCLEAKVYRKLISGLHASISTHICLDYLNQTTGEWGPSLQCYLTRVASHPERLEYIYFNTVLLLRAVARLRRHLDQYDYHFGTHDANVMEAYSKRLESVLRIAEQSGKFDESMLFSGANARALKEEFKSHFRNVSRIMDCIDCDQCRLWGKVQTTGVATALKILFEMDDNASSTAGLDSRTDIALRRSEIVALFHTLTRFSESLSAAQQFRRMWLKRNPSENETDEEVMDAQNQNTFTRSVFRRCIDGATGCADGVWSRLKSLDLFLRWSAEGEASDSTRTEL